jgi:hypothetical protein
MTRTILSSLAAAALLSIAAGGPAVGQGGADFNTWQNQFGTSTAKKRKGSVGGSQSTTVGGARTRLKGANPRPAWPSKIEGSRRLDTPSSR